MPKPFPPEFFGRIDDRDDELFYIQPRFVVHIDDGAIKKVREIYARYLPISGAILDLMSSWRSHLPDNLEAARVVGLGMNRAEMDDNPQLSEVVVHNLNREARLQFADSEFDAAVLTVSIQYMIEPVRTFREVARVLRPGAPFIVTFSNRMFPTKAVAIWHRLSDHDRVGLVAQYFMDTGVFEKIDVVDQSGPTDPPCDPIWAVIGRGMRGETA